MKFDASNIKVGDKVCLVECGNNSRRVKHEDGYCRRREGVISKIGRKYFCVTSGWVTAKFSIQDGLEVHDSCYTYKLYKTFDEYKTEVDGIRYFDEIRKDYFSGYGQKSLTKDQYEGIVSILEGINND